MALRIPIDYPEDVLTWMRQKEQEQPPYEGNSPQIKLRGALVEFILQVCEDLKQSIFTTHLAVHLLDSFMDSHNISDNQLKLTGLAVILLAAKFEEKDSNIPRVSDLNAFASSRYSITIFNRMETFILNFFEWQVGFVTAANFSEFYLLYGLTPDDYDCRMDDDCSSLIHRELWYSTQHYLDLTLQDTTFLQWKCSEVAAACMACGRIRTKLNPPWPLFLENVTGYSFQDLERLISLIRNESEEVVASCRTPESGYRSNSTKSSPASCMDS